MTDILTKIDNFFHITKDGSTIKTEFFSGLTAYFTMVYILFLVPTTIMGAFPEAFDVHGNIMKDALLHNGITAEQMIVTLTIVSCITASIGTLFLAIHSNLPFAQGPSLGISTFVTYSICVRMGYSYNEALAAVFISGLVFLIIVLLGIEKKIQDAIPSNIKFAVTAGIGFFIAFMGFQKSHLIEPNNLNLVQLVNFSEVTDHSKSALLCLFGVILIAVMLIKHIHGAILWGKLICIIIAIPLGLVQLSEFNISLSDFEVVREVLRMDFAGLFEPRGEFGIAGAVISAMVIIATLCVMDVFETMGAIIATDHIISVSHDGNVLDKMNKILHADAITTSIGSALGITNVSTYVESTAMAIEGGRTGFSGVITSILFLLTVFIAPLAAAVPSAATATTLIISGILMMDVIRFINFEDLEQAIPAFLTIIMMPLTYNIVIGVAMGLISYVSIMIFTGRGRKIKIGTIILAIIFVMQFVIMK